MNIHIMPFLQQPHKVKLRLLTNRSNKKMKNTIRKLVSALQQSGEKGLEGGFGSIRGGKESLKPTNVGCVNAKNCNEATNRIQCTNAVVCDEATNISFCSNQAFCFT
jgi:hypothetical protein